MAGALLVHTQLKHENQNTSRETLNYASSWIYMPVSNKPFALTQKIKK